MELLHAHKKAVLQIFLVNCVATIFVILLSLVSGWEVAFSTRNLFTSTIYSFCIGTFCGVSVYLFVPNSTKIRAVFRIFILALILVCAIYFGLLLANSILYFLGFVKPENIVPLNWRILIFPLAIGLVFGGGAYFYEHSQINLQKTIEKLQQKELDEAKAQTLATEAQLASLESRIHPHFLFNTLNSIAALIRDDAYLAEKTIEKLSALLRYSLYSNAKGTVSLAQEIEITEKYLEIEKIRFGERLSYRIECKPNFLEIKLPPLSLQTLVENSIKHVASKTSVKTEIVISVYENTDLIEIAVHDNGRGFSEKDVKENHGLDNLRKRLQTIFEVRGNVHILKNGGVVLQIPR